MIEALAPEASKQAPFVIRVESESEWTGRSGKWQVFKGERTLSMKTSQSEKKTRECISSIVRVVI